MPVEAGYDELRRMFDYLRSEKQVGPAMAGEHGELSEGEVSITLGKFQLLTQTLSSLRFIFTNFFLMSSRANENE